MFLGTPQQYRRKGHNVWNLLSNGSEKNYAFQKRMIKANLVKYYTGKYG